MTAIVHHKCVQRFWKSFSVVPKTEYILYHREVAKLYKEVLHQKNAQT